MIDCGYISLSLSHGHTDVMVKVASEGGIKWIATLLGSEFIVMVNEGLIALVLLVTTQRGI